MGALKTEVNKFIGGSIKAGMALAMDKTFQMAKNDSATLP
jgi:hypothetical protein